MYNNNGFYKPNGWQRSTYYPVAQQNTGAMFINPHSNGQYLPMQNQFFQGQSKQKNSPSPSKNPNKKQGGEGYNPEPQLPYYDGPYPRDQLQKARLSLINSLKNDTSDIIQRIKPRIGIQSIYGEALEIAPPEVLPDEEKSKTKEVTALPDEKKSKTKEVSAAQGSSRSSTSTISTKSSWADIMDNSSEYISTPANSPPSSTISRNPTRQDNTLSSPTSQAPVKMHSSTLTSSSQSLPPASVAMKNLQNFTITRTVQQPLVLDTSTGGGIKRKAAEELLPEVKAKKIQMASVKPPDIEDDVAGFLIYKCDSCQFQCNTRNFTKHHLKEAKHFSASLYNAKEGQLTTVEEKLAVRNKNGKNEALVVVCPQCHDIFEDIFMCGVHYKYMHGGESSNGFCSVCPVVHQETVIVYQSPMCQVCKVIYDKQENLHRHWEKETSHHPISKALSHQVFALYSCLYCNKTFHTDFLRCKTHVLGHRDTFNNPRISSAIKVRHIMKPNRIEEVLPLSETSSRTGYADELRMLRNMNKHFAGMDGTKSKISRIKERIRHLSQFNDSHVSDPFQIS